LYKELKKVLLKYSHHEIIFIDDGSTDKTASIVQDIKKYDESICLISFDSNSGKSAALNAGFEKASGDIVLTMDADLQDDPREISNLISKLNQGWDVVSGWKKKRNDPLDKTIPSKLFNYILRKTSGLNIHDFNCGFKAYKVRVIKTLNIYGGLHRFIPYLAASNGFSVTELPVNHRAREFGESKYGGSRMFKGFFDFLSVVFISKYSRRPLHIFGFIGFFLFLIGMIINFYLTYNWFLGETLSNRPILFLGILLSIVGIQFFSMGFIAELIVSYMSKENKQSEQISEK